MIGVVILNPFGLLRINSVKDLVLNCVTTKSCPEHRHARFSAATFAFGLEDLVDFGILIFVLDLRSALFDVLAGILEVLDVEFEAPRF